MHINREILLLKGCTNEEIDEYIRISEEIDKNEPYYVWNYTQTEKDNYPSISNFFNKED